MKRLQLTVSVMVLISCSIFTPSPTAPPTISPAETSTFPVTNTIPSSTFTPTSTFSPTFIPTLTETHTPIPTVESLKATVTADLLSCRYGPGSEYLYLYGLKKGANIILIGQTGGNNWVWVEGKSKCWVNAKFLEIAGDKNSLPVVYPGTAKLPRSPYYQPTTVLSATRDKNEVTVDWIDVPIDPRDYEDENMFNYIVEVWRCENGQIIFDPLPANESTITFIDEPGCAVPSHGQVFVQEKHGFAGPAEIPWPAY